MRRILLLLFTSSIVFGGCASSLPPIPDVKTQMGKECVRSCQHEHTACVGACDGKAEAVPEKSRSECNQKLKDCYERCIEEEKCHRKDFG
jgi:hypothetical protein